MYIGHSRKGKYEWHKYKSKQGGKQVSERVDGPPRILISHVAESRDLIRQMSYYDSRERVPEKQKCS